MANELGNALAGSPPELTGGQLSQMAGVTPQGQPLPLPAVAQTGPTQAPQTRDEYEQKKAGWVGKLNRLRQDPDAMAALLVIGNQLLQPRMQGQTSIGRISNAMLAGRGAMARAQSIRMGLWQQKQKMMMDRLKMEQERVTTEAAATTASAKALDAQTRAAAERREGRNVGLEQANLRADTARLQALADKAKNEAKIKSNDPQRQYELARLELQKKEGAFATEEDFQVLRDTFKRDYPGYEFGWEKTGDELPRPKTPEEALALPKGTRFITPDGREKIR